MLYSTIMTHYAALTPANIQKFFEDVQCDAERIIAWWDFCLKNQTQDKGVSLFSVPTITVKIKFSHVLYIAEINEMYK